MQAFAKPRKPAKKTAAEYEGMDPTMFLLEGRLMNKRSSTSKLFFYDLHGGAKVRVMVDARRSELVEEEFSRFHSSVKRHDIVGIIGFPGTFAEV